MNEEWRNSNESCSTKASLLFISRENIRLKNVKFLTWLDSRKKERRIGGNCVEGQFLVRTYSLHAAHSPKDNYSFAVDLKISEILARVGGTVLHWKVSPLRRECGWKGGPKGLMPAAAKVGSAREWEKKNWSESESEWREGGGEGRVPKWRVRRTEISDCFETFVFLGSPNP